MTKSLPPLALRLQPGDAVIVRHDDGTEKPHTVTARPWQLGHGAWVVGLSGVSGGYSLERVRLAHRGQP